MIFNKIDSLNIFGVKVSKLGNKSFLDCIESNISKNVKLTIAYANADTLNKIYNDKYLKKIYNSFDLVHQDGIGIYLASKFLYGNMGLKERLTGSDFYNILIAESIKNNWRYFFFGHDTTILENINKIHPSLNIAGLQEGYNYDTPKVIKYINDVNPDIIIIGLSCPIQEKWIYINKDKINFKVILAVGDGIKIFANQKIRGPVFVRRIGLEWLSRYISSPISNFRKYIIGNPLFIYRVFKERLKSFN